MPESREVMMAFGGYDVGKTRAYVSIAQYERSKIIHAVWSDRALDKLYEIYPEAQLNTCEHPVSDFDSSVAAISKIRQEIGTGNGREHWIASDTIGQIYRSTQEDFSRTFYGKDLEVLLDERTKMGQAGKGLIGLIDGFQSWEWRRIRDRFYNDYFFVLLRRMQTHLFFAAHTVPQRGPNYTRPDAIVAKDRFKRIGMLPDVHNAVPGFLDSLLYFGIEDDGTHTMQTIKESGKREVLNEPTPFTDFWPDYNRLVKNV
jgi:hypothetical protein